MTIAYRLARKKYPIELSGKGAAKRGARWNSPGTEVIYAAESRALAMAEVAVHLTIATLPDDFVMLEIGFPDSVSVLTLSEDFLPEDWNAFPHPASTQRTGDDFVRELKAGVLRVPSAVVQGDHNLLINPAHADFSQIKIINQADFPFDKRLFKS